VASFLPRPAASSRSPFVRRKRRSSGFFFWFYPEDGPSSPFLPRQSRTALPFPSTLRAGMREGGPFFFFPLPSVTLRWRQRRAHLPSSRISDAGRAFFPRCVSSGVRRRFFATVSLWGVPSPPLITSLGRTPLCPWEKSARFFSLRVCRARSVRGSFFFSAWKPCPPRPSTSNQDIFLIR